MFLRLFLHMQNYDTFHLFLFHNRIFGALHCWTHSIQQSTSLVCHQMHIFRVIIRIVQWTTLTSAQIKINQLLIPLNQRKQNVYASRSFLAWICFHFSDIISLLQGNPGGQGLAGYPGIYTTFCRQIIFLYVLMTQQN